MRFLKKELSQIFVVFLYTIFSVTKKLRTKK